MEIYKCFIFQIRNFKELSKIESPHIIKAINIFQIDTKPVFIQEFLDIDLHDYIEEFGRLSFDNVLRLFHQMAEALCVLEVS